jgi:hypothetical protein
METGSDFGYRNSDRSFTYARLNRPFDPDLPCEDWSLTSLKEKLIKIGATVVSHGRYIAFQMAEVAILRILFADILRLIAELRPPPVVRLDNNRIRIFGAPLASLLAALQACQEPQNVADLAGTSVYLGECRLRLSRHKIAAHRPI